MSNTVRREILNKRDNFHNKHVNVGPGGKRCSCCFPAPGKLRRKLIKTARRRERIADFLIEEINAPLPNEDINYMTTDDMWLDEIDLEYEESFLSNLDYDTEEYQYEYEYQYEDEYENSIEECPDPYTDAGYDSDDYAPYYLTYDEDY